MVCGGFEYPAILDYLDPLEWACVAAIKAARRASENSDLKRQRQEADRKRRMEELKALSGG